MEITRGDSKGLYFQRKRDGQPILQEAENIYFTVKVNNNTEEAVFQKTIADMTFDEDGYYHFTINPEDTNGLNYGDYVYDIEVKIADYTKTISQGTLSITKETTFPANEV